MAHSKRNSAKEDNTVILQCLIDIHLILSCSGLEFVSSRYDLKNHENPLLEPG